MNSPSGFCGREEFGEGNEEWRMWKV